MCRYEVAVSRGKIDAGRLPALAPLSSDAGGGTAVNVPAPKEPVRGAVAKPPWIPRTFPNVEAINPEYM